MLSFPVFGLLALLKGTTLSLHVFCFLLTQS